MNKKTLALELGVDEQNYDERCWDFTFEDKVIFLVASNEIETLWGRAELFYDVKEDAQGGRKKRAELRQQNVKDVLLGSKKGYVLVRADKFLEDFRDNHQWKLVNGLTVFQVTGNSLDMDKRNVGWLDVDALNKIDIFSI